MKLIDTIAVVTEKDGTVRTTITSREVVLDALCAYRDELIKSDDWDTLETTSRLVIIEKQIAEVWSEAFAQ